MFCAGDSPLLLEGAPIELALERATPGAAVAEPPNVAVDIDWELSDAIAIVEGLTQTESTTADNLRSGDNSCLQPTGAEATGREPPSRRGARRSLAERLRTQRCEAPQRHRSGLAEPIGGQAARAWITDGPDDVAPTPLGRGPRRGGVLSGSGAGCTAPARHEGSRVPKCGSRGDPPTHQEEGHTPPRHTGQGPSPPARMGARAPGIGRKATPPARGAEAPASAAGGSGNPARPKG